jgi:predicted DNA-binding transcriptional regulator YafY
MSRKEALIRYKHIVHKLRRKPSSFSEIADYLKRQSEIEDYDFTISKRTFKRDTEDIFSLWSIDIKYDFAEKVYYIADEGDPAQKDKLFEAFDTLYLLNMTEDLSNYIHLERTRPKGTDNLYGLIHAIKNKLRIQFDYEKYWDDAITHRQVEPYALKEFKNRWYLLGKAANDSYVKTFALDRMTELEITNTKVEVLPSFNIKEMFKYCYGIITPKDQQPEEIILSFYPEQGKYIKSLPLHESQEIVVDNEDEFQITLKLYITHDFKMELLSYGENVKVLLPASLAEQLKADYEKAWKQYGSSQI